MSEVTLKVNAERLEELPFDVYRKSNTDPMAQARMVAHFMVDEDGKYMEEAEAIDGLDALTLGEVRDTVAQLREMADEEAAPKE